MIMCLGSGAFARDEPFSLREEQTINMLLSDVGRSGDYSNIKILKDGDDTNRYYYLPFTTPGYLIYDSALNLVHEYSIISTNKHIDGKSDLYYSGALGYYEKQEDMLIEISSNNPVGNATAFRQFTAVNTVRMRGKKASTIMPRLAGSSETISGSLPNYSYNIHNNCGSTAAAMMLRWYDIYKNSGYVPSNLESGSGSELITRLISHIEPNHQGSLVGNLFPGILDYCSSQGVSHPGGYDTATTNSIVGRVSTYQAPFVLGLDNYPGYGNHWVTGYGYSMTGSSFFTIVNDGWGSTGVYIDIINSDYIVW